MGAPPRLVLAALVAAALGLALATSCAHATNFGAGGSSPLFTSGPTAGATTGAGGSACPACAASKDCSAGELCATFGGQAACAPDCSNGQACTDGRTCSAETSTEGAPVRLCVPTGGCAAGATTTGGSTSSGTTASSSGSAATGASAGSGAGTCGGLVEPQTTSCCMGCKTNGKTCNPNGCYGTYFCDASTCKCHPPPGGC